VDIVASNDTVIAIVDHKKSYMFNVLYQADMWHPLFAL